MISLSCATAFIRYESFQYRCTTESLGKIRDFPPNTRRAICKPQGLLANHAFESLMAILGDMLINAKTSCGYSAASISAIVPPVDVLMMITLSPIALPIASASLLLAHQRSGVK